MRRLAALWVAVFWMALVAYPVFTLLSRAHGDIPLWDPVILSIVRITLAQALASALISAAIALPLGLWAAGGRAGLFFSLPFGVPSVAAAMAWVVWLGRSGWLARLGIPLDWIYRWNAVILAQVIFNIPWIALWVLRARSVLPERRLEAARTLGAGVWARFRFVIWPQIRWPFLSALCQAWVFCAMSFTLVLVLGGGPPVQTLETAIYASIRYSTLDLSRGIALAIWEFAIALVPWVLVVFFQSLESKGSVTVSGASTRRSRGAWIAAIFLLPYLAVLPQLRLPFDSAVFPAFRTSLALAVGASFGAVVTALCEITVLRGLSGRSRAALIFLLGLPSGISALVLGLALWISYRRWIDPFSGSRTAMIALEMAIFTPIAFRIFWPVAQESPRRLHDAAATLGASPWRAFWTVEWIRWKFPILCALGMVAAASLGEVAAVSLFYSEDLVPLPLLISRWMGQYRFEEAQACAALLLVLCMGVFAAVFRYE